MKFPSGVYGVGFRDGLLKDKITGMMRVVVKLKYINCAVEK